MLIVVKEENIESVYRSGELVGYIERKGELYRELMITGKYKVGIV